MTGHGGLFKMCIRDRVGTAPTLPETMDVIYPDGTVKNSTILWDEVPESSYAEKGEFTVSGTVKDTEMKVEARVMVVSGKACLLYTSWKKSEEKK